MECYIIEHYLNGHGEPIAVFSLEADAKAYVDQHNAARKGERREIEEWSYTELPLNPTQ